MIRFVSRRLLAMIPTLFGISLVTFVVLNLSMNRATPTAEVARVRTSLLGGRGVDERSYFTDRHLPLFVNFSISDARTHAMAEIERLDDVRAAPQAKRALIRIGGAWLPYMIPMLELGTPRQKAELLDALGQVAVRMGLEEAISSSHDPITFWQRYWKIYRADFKPVRAGRLVRRVLRRSDPLAESELYGLDTFALPQLIEALEEPVSTPALARVVDIIVKMTGINDPLPPDASVEQRNAVCKRWQDWWFKRYDKYTVFDGASRLAGFVTETRYYRWLMRIVTFDFGTSTRDGRPVLEKLMRRLPVTLLLSILGLLFAYALAVPIGILSAVRRGGVFDRTMNLVVYILYSLPTFWLAVILIRFAAGADYLDLFPAQGISSSFSESWPLWRRALDTAHHLVLPIICLSSVSLAMLARYQRVGMIQVINLDYMRAARAKGLSERQALIRHGLRNGVIPVITMLGLQIPYLVSGSVIVERIFGIQGMGYETIEAIRAQDQPWLMAVVTVTAVMTMIGVVAADAIHAAIDPRVTPGEGGLKG